MGKQNDVLLDHNPMFVWPALPRSKKSILLRLLGEILILRRSKRTCFWSGTITGGRSIPLTLTLGMIESSFTFWCLPAVQKQLL